MSKNVVIIDYQLGNLFSVKQACEHLGYHSIVSTNPDELKKADYAILPGVGAFADAMTNLQSFGLVDAIHSYVEEGKPLMGVCLGLQLLLTESEEFGSTKGLNIIPGTVRKFNTIGADGKLYKVPQIQWNVIEKPDKMKWENTPLQCCKSGDFMYFVHSFYAEPVDEKYVLSQSEYSGLQYCSSVKKNNVFATQFHPEKSGLYGVNIYKEWFNLYC
jgi:glutamine amidotransferase